MAASTQRANRPQRTPLGRRNVLTASARKGYQRRWVNDTDDRLLRAQEAGYTFVQDPTANTSDQVAGDPAQMGSATSKSVGKGVRAYLMEIPEDFYREDQAAKQKDVDASEAGLRAKTDEGQYGAVELGEGMSRKRRTG